MTYHRGKNENDRLRGEFSVWLEKLIVRSKLDYIRNNRRYLDFVSIDELSDEALSVCEEPISSSKYEFEFDNDRLEKAFMELSSLRRRILTMLFVEKMTPEEIAVSLNCSVDAVYNNRSRALKKLRQALREEENN